MMNQQAEPERRPEQQRRPQPDRGIILLDAKDRIGPKIWALYGRVEKPVILRDDTYIDNRFNGYYRDAQGHAFLLVPLVDDNAPDRYEQADLAYRRAVALGVTEGPELFFTCLYQFEIPDYCCVDIHAAKPDEILLEDKCLTLMGFEKARLAPGLDSVEFVVAAGLKVKPVSVLHASAESSNLMFATNTLVLHHGYGADQLNQCWAGL